MRLLDTSVIVAYLNEDDELHYKTKEVDLNMTAFNELVLAEVANVLQKRVGEKAKVRQFLNTIIETTPMVLNTAGELQEAIKIFFEHYPKVSFTDAALSAQAKALNVEVLTFDENLIRILKS